MPALESDSFISAAPPPLVAWRGFGEPDWGGDYPRRMAEADLDAMALALQAVIEEGRRSGDLDDYYARRAGFELQSIRGQLARERRAAQGPIPAARLGAILSRLDRLSLCVGAESRPAAE